MKNDLIIIIWPRGEPMYLTHTETRLHAMYTCCVHLSILAITNFTVLFLSPSKIALEVFYFYPPPQLLDEMYALE